MPAEPRPQQDLDLLEDLKSTLIEAKSNGQNQEAAFEFWKFSLKLKRRLTSIVMKHRFDFR